MADMFFVGMIGDGGDIGDASSSIRMVLAWLSFFWFDASDSPASRKSPVKKTQNNPCIAGVGREDQKCIANIPTVPTIPTN